jgi:hypothetical protein
LYYFFWEANKTILILPISAQNKTKTKQIRYQIPQKQGMRPGFQTGQLPLTPVPLMTPSPNSYDQLRKYRFSSTFWGKKIAFNGDIAYSI